MRDAEDRRDDGDNKIDDRLAHSIVYTSRHAAAKMAATVS